ncbi:MAG: proton-conducting membrane transporter [Lachnospiraceae bacterium]|nr:proton-conducting membrane transporter [Lachnospiraceae bacterium]
MNNNMLLLIPILLPIICGLAAGLFGKLRVRARYKGMAIVAMLAVEAIASILCLRIGMSLVVGSINEAIRIVFRVDALSRMFGALVVFVWFLTGIYACEYLKKDKHFDSFFAFYLMTEGMIMALAEAGNMITFYMFFEMMTMLSFPMVMHDRTHEAIRAGLKYMFYSVAGALMSLFAIFMLTPYGYLGDFKAGGILDIEALTGHEQVLLISALMMIVGLGTKAGMFPMHAWLPTAHPEAPAPASAVLSGVITKTGVIGIIRGVYYCIGSRLLAGTWVQHTWLVLSLITVLMGSMLAYREPVLKKRLAYSTVSQVSYMMFGLAIMNSVAFTGAVSHIVFHSLIKTTLFLVAGAVIHQTGHTRVEELRAIGKEMPVTMCSYTIVSLGLIGIPPLSGFVSKWYLASGALMSGTSPYSWLGPVILLISALLTAGYLLPVTVRGFFPGVNYGVGTPNRAEPDVIMYVPMIVMSVMTLILGIYPGLITTTIQNIAAGIF